MLPESGDRGRFALFAAVLLIAALPRAGIAIWSQGIFWPDEIFQSLEQLPFSRIVLRRSDGHLDVTDLCS